MKKSLCVWEVLSITLMSVVLVSARAAGDDWPGWRGLNRDGLCKETGLLKSWPAKGPKLLWKVKGMGEGFSEIGRAHV
jgi:outer membrane protein assembly factor BamB